MGKFMVNSNEQKIQQTTRNEQKARRLQRLGDRMVERMAKEEMTAEAKMNEEILEDAVSEEDLEAI